MERKIEKLSALVEEAFDEGYIEGGPEYPTVGWDDSDAKKALDALGKEVTDG